jgi:4'-phosphopantetheinyl transferase
VQILVIDLREELPPLEPLLSPDEQARAARLLREADRRRFVVGRTALRAALGQHLGVPGASLVLRLGLHGKPELDPAQGFPPVGFNVAHSGDLILIAITPDRRVGVDVERIRADVDLDRIARRAFSAREYRELCQLPGSERREAFFCGWTRKEAFLKAHGAGITLGLDRFDVPITPGVPPRLLATRWDPAETGRWHLQDLAVKPGYRAALAVEADPGCQPG